MEALKVENTGKHFRVPTSSFFGPQEREEYDRVFALNFSRAQRTKSVEEAVKAWENDTSRQPWFLLGECVHRFVLDYGPEEPYELTSCSGDSLTRLVELLPKRSRSEWELVRGVVQTQRLRSTICDYSSREYSMVWRDFSGCWMKGRVDGYNENEGTVLDIKTTRDLRRLKLTTYGYDLQAVWYMNGLRALGKRADAIRFLVIDKTTGEIGDQTWKYDDLATSRVNDRIDDAIELFLAASKTEEMKNLIER